MNTSIEQIYSLRRPRLMLRAARFGMADYRRKRDLRRILKCAETPGPELALRALLTAESKLEEARLTRDTAYSVTRHVDVLICLLAETQSILQTKSNVQTLELA